ncbi:hypothetical protein BDV96DRAFT_586742 [Lophiotrema nucula]|uniref:S-adenosyl-L-methionine-dependent methyltransferase n=1 Tax=Lophiotrema nucula TaxID=690887 RepID=A0A6A5YNV2_9PLEO|nr:hypothetical protein BDV96DRAFT_586742 [Lophiotrema nucula]
MAAAQNRHYVEIVSKDWSDAYVPSETNGKSFKDCICEAFEIPKKDNYTYKAHGQTTLDITQKAIDGKRKNSLHNWYHDEEGQKASEPPSLPEIEAYIALFDPSVSLPKALNGFKANAKANTIRSAVATHLTSRFLNKTQGLLPSKKDRTHKNPYLSMWAYSCRELEWAGPWPNTRYTKISHHILPIFYHHFGCVVPSYAALWVIAKLAQPARPSKEPVRPILDIGSGNGYWTFMLRNLPLEGNMLPLKVYPVDNAASEYRFDWLQDAPTIKMDGLNFLKNYSEGGFQTNGGKGCVLLLVYPQATGDFTESLLRAFSGDTIVVAGTQTQNGFTAFQEEMVDEWIEKNLPEFGLTLRMPLPSFAGKDEALFVFQRKKVEE